MSSATIARIARYVAMGILNTAFGYGVFAALYLLTGWPRVAILLATVIGVIFNFFTIGPIVFGRRALSLLVPFVLGYAFVLVLNIIAADRLLQAGLNALVAQLVCLPFVVLISYIINDRLVFRSRPQGK